MAEDSYQALGGLAGITRLVEQFYFLMDTLPEAQALRDMHPQDLRESREKLVAFLSGWMGGPNLYAERYGSLSLPVAHQHLPVDKDTEQQWLVCMRQALAVVNCPEVLSEQLLERFARPAQSIRLQCEFKQNPPAAGGGLFDPV